MTRAWLIGTVATAVLGAACMRVEPRPVTTPEPPDPVVQPTETSSARTSSARRSGGGGAESGSSDRDPRDGTSRAGGPTSSGRGAQAERIGARHILIQWMGADKAAASIVRTRDQARSIAEQVLARAKAGEDVARLAVEFSDEPGAAGRGGSLGVFPRGQMVKAFEDAAFRLQVGEVVGLVETPFGFHIIQRTQ